MKASPLSTSVIIASIGRPERLALCLRSLAAQTVAPGEIIIIWQADDLATRDCVNQLARELPLPLHLVHHPEPNMVEALNAGIRTARNQIILRIDDDAIAPPDWIERHLSHFIDPSVGAVGGPYDNFAPDGLPFPKHWSRPVAKITWYGKAFGNMFDHPPNWHAYPPAQADHLIGANLSLRRGAFDSYDIGLKPYWQSNEIDICLQVKARGYRVIFDYRNVVGHHPSSEYASLGRDGNLDLKVYNGAYNYAFVLSKHSPALLRWVRLLYLMIVGSVAAPGLIASVVAIRRYGNPRREAAILLRTWRSKLEGWRDGAGARPALRRVIPQCASR